MNGVSRRRRIPAGTKRDFPRVARVNELLREVLADELERIDREDLGFVTVTAVQADPEFRTATVFLDHLDDERAAALEQERGRLQRAIAAQVRLRNTPTLRFLPDPAIDAGERVDHILRALDLPPEGPGSSYAGSG